MTTKKNETLRAEFLEELTDEIIGKRISIREIIEKGKSKAVPGLSHNLVRDLLGKRGIILDTMTKEWKKISEIGSNSDSKAAGFNQLESNNNASNQENEIVKTTETEKITPPASPMPLSKSNDSSPYKSSKKIEELILRVTEQEELIQELLSKVSVIEEQIREKTEKSLSKSSSLNSLDVLKFVELSYSNGRRYEITIREDLVDKATEKLKSKYDLKSVDLTKVSRLFEIILFDYINS